MIFDSFLNFIKQNLYPIFGVKASDLENDFTKKFYFFTTMAVTIIFSLFFLQAFLVGIYDLSFLHLLTVLTTLFSWFVFKKTNSLSLSANIILTFSTCFTIYAVNMMGGVNAPLFITYCTVPLFTAAVMPFNFSFFWTTVYSLIIIGYYIANGFGITFPSRFPPSSIEQVRIFALIAIQFTILFVINHIRSINKKYRELIDEQKNQKTNLVRILSHDIATPVTVLKKCLNNLEKQVPNDSSDIKRMSHSIKIITNILEHVRELDAVSSGKKELTLQKINMLEIFDELKHLHLPSFESKKINFHIHTQDLGGHFQVMADRKGLTYQVLNNLISNAIKFTETNGTIEIQLISTPSNTTCAIKDSGVGMPKELVKQIFSETAKTTRPGTHGEKGTGFGMPIVKNYIERFKGKIEIKSSLKEDNQQDHGTTVTITLPNAS